MSDDAASRLHLATERPADELLATDPLALLIGMLLDQQIPMERAFVAPYRLAQRLGTDRLDAASIAEHEPEALAEIFATPPALHRFPGSMAARTQKLCAAVSESFGGDASAVWSDVASGAELVKRLKALPGFGAAKAQIFAALLAKQFGVRPDGWQEATGDYSQRGFRSVADITDDESLQKVREHKQQMKAAAKAAKGGSG